MSSIGAPIFRGVKIAGLPRTLLTPTSGSIGVDGQDPATHRVSVRRKFGIVFQHTSDQELTAAENMRLLKLFEL